MLASEAFTSCHLEVLQLVIDRHLFPHYHKFGVISSLQVIARSSLHINSETEVINAVARSVLHLDRLKGFPLFFFFQKNKVSTLIRWSVLHNGLTQGVFPLFSKPKVSTLIRWSRAECLRRGEEESSKACREKLQGAQYLIRLKPNQSAL